MILYFVVSFIVFSPHSVTPSLSQQRIEGDQFIPVTEKEFKSVSELIRQRVKLEEVNKVCSYTFFLNKENQITTEYC